MRSIASNLYIARGVKQNLKSIFREKSLFNCVAADSENCVEGHV